MLYGIICVYLLAKAYECNVRYFILHRNVPLRSDVVQFFAFSTKNCSLNPFALIHSRNRHTHPSLTLSLLHTLRFTVAFLPLSPLPPTKCQLVLLERGSSFVAANVICYNGGAKKERARKSYGFNDFNPPRIPFFPHFASAVVAARSNAQPSRIYR